MGFNIIIVGSGIAGLAAATALSQKGHKVTVLEEKPSLNEFGASIGILANGVRCLRAWGLESKFKPVVTTNGFLDIRNAADNRRLGRLLMNYKDQGQILYGEQAWNIHRADYQQTLADAAKENGAAIVFNANCVRIDVERPAVILEDGRELTADLIVGADGIRSAVRKSIPALADIEILPHLEHAYRCTVPKERMAGVPKLDWLLQNGDEMMWSAQGKYILSWPLPDNRPYDVVCGDIRESHLPPGKWGIKGDPKEVERICEDFCPEVRDLLARIDGCVQWALAELPALDTFKSENGKVVLIGDACHAMIPHSASGGNSAIEDAAVLSECISFAFAHNSPVGRGTEIYETLRKPRVHRMQAASHEGYQFLGCAADFRSTRDAVLAETTKAGEADLELSEEERRAKEPPPGDMNARFPSPAYLQWLYGADVIREAKSYLADL